jgi:hypothetical protein
MARERKSKHGAGDGFASPAQVLCKLIPLEIS